MDIDQAKQDILDWITNFVEQPHPALGGWPPCPFARRARLDQRVDIRAGGADPYFDLQKHTEMGNWQVIVLVYDAGEFEASEFNQQIDLANSGFLVPRGMIALGDHPQDPETINGVSMNQGTYAMAFVQDLNELNRHAQQLANKKFYQDWPEPYLETLFQHRQDPRQ